jgi:hypothetical protein
MKSPKKSKHHFINEIINIIKKYNISIEDIVKEYIYKYESNFTSEEKIIHNIQYQKFIKYSKEDFLKNKPSVFWFNKYQIIDDYVLI